MSPEENRNGKKPTGDVSKTWKTSFEVPVGVSLSAQRQVEVMTAKLGSTPERKISFPCEQHIPGHDAEFFRGESIETTGDMVFHVLEQTVEGQKKERTLSKPFIDVLDLEHGRQITLRLHFGGFLVRFIAEVVATYLVVPRSGASCRLLVKALVRYRRGWVAWLRPAVSTALTHHFRRDLLEIKRTAEGARSTHQSR